MPPARTCTWLPAKAAPDELQQNLLLLRLVCFVDSAGYTCPAWVLWKS